MLLLQQQHIWWKKNCVNWISAYFFSLLREGNWKFPCFHYENSMYSLSALTHFEYELRPYSFVSMLKNHFFSSYKYHKLNICVQITRFTSWVFHSHIWREGKWKTSFKTERIEEPRGGNKISVEMNSHSIRITASKSKFVHSFHQMAQFKSDCDAIIGFSIPLKIWSYSRNCEIILSSRLFWWFDNVLNIFISVEI